MLENYLLGYENVNKDNLEKYYYDWDGNIYYKDENMMHKDNKYYAVDGFDLEDLRAALDNGVKMIFLYGNELPPFNEEDVLDV